jgi:isoleucyl-tRNA synthetase
LLEEWRQLLSVRDQVLVSLEAARKEKRIGKALEAKVRLTVPPQLAPLVDSYRLTLKELFNVSQVEIESAPASSNAGELQVTTLPADGQKCARCWNYSVHVGESAQWPAVCDRCAAALETIGAPPTVATVAESATARSER